VINTLGGFPVYNSRMDNHSEHLESIKHAIGDDSYWTVQENWKSKTQSTIGNLRQHELPINQITHDVAEHFKEYMKLFNPHGYWSFDISSWMNRYGKGDYQEAHNHLGGHLSFPPHFSFAYMLRTFNDDSFVFSYESSLNHMSNLFGTLFKYEDDDSFVWAHTSIPKQEEGTLLIFPSSLGHYVLPNKRDDYRVTMSGNIILVVDDE